MNLKKTFNPFKNPLVVLILLIVIVAIISHIGKQYKLVEDIAIVLSSLITFSGWMLSTYLNNRDFQRSEIVRNKDKLTLLVEEFFDGISELLARRSSTEQDLEDFISDKVTHIEFKARQLEIIFKQKETFISQEKLSEMRDKPIDFMSLEFTELSREIKNLKFNILQDIEKKYTDWLENQ
ncbi:hypothetical protein M9411_03495 [Pasteurella multocida]|uniref:hypothetical protein n=1 Tax=Pasteurella multocida TaxID=747 RepID=UPI002024B89C|nr:hypothetical protein [Pasteurella multocida]URJ85779.1 hypothetical protein M9411_03495 [Pasteurella multocida]